MASLNPSQNSTVTLYKGVDIDNDESLIFSSVINRNTYFAQHTTSALTHIKCSPIKKESGSIKIKANLADVMDCNYMSFINPNFGDKKYFCRIVIDPDFSTKSTVIVSYIIDWWMTDMFDTEFDECYIERSGLSEADYRKSLDNPYDPSILEFRTSESALPINKDIEKPYYEIDNDGSKDGLFIGETVKDAFNLVTPDAPGCLIVFSDVGLANLDADPSAQTAPSSTLYGLITSMVYSNLTSKRSNLCFYKLSPSTYEYLSSQYDPQHDYDMLEKGGNWPGSFDPLLSNTIEAPVNYVYLDDLSQTITATDTRTIFSELLNWFVDIDSTDSILGLYAIPASLMFFSGSDSAYSNPLEVRVPTADDQNVINKKLDLYPFSYYRIISPNGDIKEIRMEDFKNVQDGTEEPYPGHNEVLCHIGITLDCVEKPSLLVAPRNYQIDGITPKNDDVNMNLLQGLVFEQFSTLPYSYDAFRAAMAAQANAIIGNNTVQYEYDLAERAGGNKMLLGGLKAQVTEQLKEISGSINSKRFNNPLLEVGRQVSGAFIDVAGLQAASESANYSKIDNELNMHDQAYKVLSGDTDNAVYENSKYARPAYACNEYHPMSGSSLNYNINSFLDVLILRVQINPTILAQYDKYLTMFGMSSGKCQVPLVKNFVDGVDYDIGDNNQVLPHWYTLNGRSVYYIKTTNCKIVKKNLVSAAFIKQMFDNGVRFINGDTLISNE